VSTINFLSNKKASRSSDLGTQFTKCAKLIRAPILCTIFSMCFELGIFHDSLKVAEIVPIYKKGDLTNATNYRPILLLSHNSIKFLRKLYRVIW